MVLDQYYYLTYLLVFEAYLLWNWGVICNFLNSDSPYLYSWTAFFALDVCASCMIILVFGERR